MSRQRLKAGYIGYPGHGSRLILKRFNAIVGDVIIKHLQEPCMAESAVADDIGRLGEIFFDLIANKADLLVGKIDPDRMGKDRVIEAKLAPRTECVSFDKRPAPLACSIQIKSILSSTKVVSLSLSVAERLAQTSQPTFICIVRIDSNYDVFEMRLIHILDVHLAKILKRLRQEFAKGTSDLTNKTISFNIKSAKTIGIAPGNLRSALENAIGPDMDGYAATKVEQKKTVGYVEGKQTCIEGSISATNMVDLVDGLLGLRPLPLAVLNVSEERFGIKLPDVRFAGASVSKAIFAPKSTANFNLTFGEAGSSKSVTLVFEATMPAFIPVTATYFKALLKSKYLQAVVGSQKIEFRSVDGWEIDQTKPLSDWITYYKLISALETPDCQFLLQGPNGVQAYGTARLSGQRQGDAVHIVKLMSAFQKLRDEAGCDDSPVSLRAIHDAFTDITNVHSFMTSEDGPKGLSFKTVGEFIEAEAEVGLLYIGQLHVGHQRFAYAMKCRVAPTRVGNDVRWTQASRLMWIGLDAVRADEADFERYRTRQMRAVDAQLCLSVTLEAEEITK